MIDQASISRDFLGHLARLWNGNVDVDHLYAWLAGAEDDIEEFGSDAEVELARALELRFAEFTSGHIDRPRLISALRREIEASGIVPELAAPPSAVPSR